MGSSRPRGRSRTRRPTYRFRRCRSTPGQPAEMRVRIACQPAIRTGLSVTWVLRSPRLLASLATASAPAPEPQSAQPGLTCVSRDAMRQAGPAARSNAQTTVTCVAMEGIHASRSPFRLRVVPVGRRFAAERAARRKSSRATRVAAVRRLRHLAVTYAVRRARRVRMRHETSVAPRTRPPAAPRAALKENNAPIHRPACVVPRDSRRAEAVASAVHRASPASPVSAARRLFVAGRAARVHVSTGRAASAQSRPAVNAAEG